MAEPFIGQLAMYGFNFAPVDWALCDGQTLPITSNPALYAVIGTLYGGNGQTVFGLPDLRGRVPLHSGYDVSQGQPCGLPTVVLNPNTAPAHTHSFETVQEPGAALAGNGRVVAEAGVPGSLPFGVAANTVAMNAGMLQSTGGGEGHDNYQPSLAITFAIALKGLFPSRP